MGDAAGDIAGDRKDVALVRALSRVALLDESGDEGDGKTSSLFGYGMT